MALTATAPPEPGSAPGECFAEDLSWLLSQAAFALGAQVHAAFEGLGVSPRGYHVLEAATTGPHTQSELVDIVGLDKTTMVVTIDELEAAGLAAREPCSRDRRARLIAVTAEGERKLAEGRAIVHAVQAGALDGLPDARREAFVATLHELVRTRLAEPSRCPTMRRRQPKA